ncbi:acetylglutamate kinase [Alphaproteobacteria bacterium]|nr:acetylglutamate kinase [Alphaproteobacteria bacterium]GIS15395.1 MAG: acetylglutamate kinase [Alphaproteobacteria bacterium]
MQSNSSKSNMWLDKVATLIESLPYMKQYSGLSVVIKFGGHAMGEQASIEAFASDIVLLQQVGAKPVVVHGGGPQIGSMLSRLEMESNFIDGLRVTDQQTISIVEMVLAGAINKSLVTSISAAGGMSVGISGKDGNLIIAKKLNHRTKDTDSAIENLVDLGYVGIPDKVDKQVLDALLGVNMIPVVAPLGLGADGQTYNINADTAAGSIASALNASRLLMLTDVDGVLDDNGKLIPRLSIAQARQLILDGVIKGGMIPKVETCIQAVQSGAGAAVILDGRKKHAVLVELFTEHGIGTLIHADE